MAFTSYQGPDFSFETTSLEALGDWATRAIAARRVPCVYLRASWCPPNVKIERSLGDPQMARAFREVAAATLDIDTCGAQAQEAGFDARSVPVFFIIDAQGRPTGAKITGAAWGENTPENMAPPLERFFDAAREARPAPVARASSAAQAPSSPGAYAPPVARTAEADQAARSPGTSRFAAVLMVVGSLTLIGFAAWLKVSSDEADKREKADAEQSERIRKDVDATIRSSLKAQKGS